MYGKRQQRSQKGNEETKEGKEIVESPGTPGLCFSWYYPCMKRVILASASHWRKELLRRARVQFEVEVSNYTEDFAIDANPAKIAEKLALGKAEDVAKKYTDAIVIGADTVIVFEGKPLGKPEDRNQAREWLTSFSGKTLQAYTGIAMIDTTNGMVKTFTDCTNLTFRDLAPEEIEEYIATDEPQTVAGAFAIQGGAASFIENIQGDFYTIVGLPLSRVVVELRKF